MRVCVLTATVLLACAAIGAGAAAADSTRPPGIGKPISVTGSSGTQQLRIPLDSCPGFASGGELVFDAVDYSVVQKDWADGVWSKAKWQVDGSTTVNGVSYTVDATLEFEGPPTQRENEVGEGRTVIVGSDGSRLRGDLNVAVDFDPANNFAPFWGSAWFPAPTCKLRH
jgi:hypothetical protein